MYPYSQLFGASPPEPRPFLSKPTGFSFFPKELYPGIKKALETQVNLIDWQRHDKGGHFAALEEPEALLKDVEGFAEKVWKV
jgi:microsomal epoxide hydrolase